MSDPRTQLFRELADKGGPVITDKDLTEMTTTDRPAWAPRVPEVWWSPRLGLIERAPRIADDDQEEPLVRVQTRHAVHRLPADAIRLVPENGSGATRTA